MLGGFGDAKPADDEVKKVVNETKADVEKKLGTTFNVFEPVCYKTQVVAGVNYLVKIKVDGDKYVHAKIYQPLPNSGKPRQVLTATANHGKDDKL